MTADSPVLLDARVRRIDGKLAYHGVVLPPGPWHDEPDRVEFEHAGHPCILLRNSSWCGYVAVPPGHPWHGKGYADVNDPWPEVHGGLTYSERCTELVCHVAKPGDPDDVWWLGFDCNHSGDMSLSDLYMSVRHPLDGLWVRNGHDLYRDVEYVRGQTERLAEQAKAATP